MIQCDIVLQEVKEHWGREEFTNWLHPYHGPLPDFLCTAHTATDHYVVAGWLHQTHCITVLECPKKPVGRGSVLWTARWPMDEDGQIWNRSREKILTLPIRTYDTAEEFLHELIPAVVLDAENTPLSEVRPASQLRFRPAKN